MDAKSVAAEAAAQRYKVLLSLLSDVFHRASLTPSTGRNTALRSAYMIASGYIDTETSLIDRQVMAEAEAARGRTLVALGIRQSALSDGQLDHVQAIAADLQTALRVQVERDLAAMTRALREVALSRSLQGRSYRAPARSTRSPEFVYLDRASRKWRPDILVRSIWRQSLVFSDAETVMTTIVEHGQSRAIVEHPSSSYEYAGLVISLDQQGDLPTWDDVREQIFHPNTAASLAPQVSNS